VRLGSGVEIHALCSLQYTQLYYMYTIVLFIDNCGDDLSIVSCVRSFLLHFGIN
jgi:hypothetical protein